MKTILFIKAILSSAMFFGFIGCNSASNNSTNHMNILNLNQKATAVIKTYVNTSRGWKISDYRIEERGRDGGLIIYVVVYLEDEKNPNPYPGGSGKSFMVYYDPQKQAIIKDLAFQ